MRTASMKHNYFPLWTECPRRRREQAAALERLLPNGSQTPRVSAARPRAGLACVRPSPADMPHGAKRPARMCTRPPTADRLVPPAAPAPGADGRPCGDPEAPCAFAVINAPVRSPRMEAERWEGKRRNATGSAPAARRGLLPRTPSARRTEVWGRHPLGFHVRIAPV